MSTNKHREVLRHLRESGSITSDEAWRMFGVTRLSAIIFNLRKKGHDIETVTMGTTDRYGHAVNYAKYVLHEKEDSQETLQIE